MKKLISLLLILSLTPCITACVNTPMAPDDTTAPAITDTEIAAADSESTPPPAIDYAAKIPENYTSAYLYLSGSTAYVEPIKEKYYDSLNTIIRSVSTAPTKERKEDDTLLIDATVRLVYGDLNVIYISFYSDGRVTVTDSMGAAAKISVVPDADTYASHITSLCSMSFDPDAFAELIPNENMRVVSWHKLFISSLYLYFCVGRTDPTEFAVYYTWDYGDTIGILDIPMPPLDYDRAVPVCVGGGGGSGECEFIVRLDKGDAVTYVSYNNFSYTDDVTEFIYAGEVSDEHLEWLMSQYPEAFHKDTSLSEKNN